MSNATTPDACPGCGEPVDCGMANGVEPCWCAALPAALPVAARESAARCYCRSCLQRMTMSVRPSYADPIDAKATSMGASGTRRRPTDRD
jgi:Cysteine-rich CWC